jgi:hypothetical protein
MASDGEIEDLALLAGAEAIIRRRPSEAEAERFKRSYRSKLGSQRQRFLSAMDETFGITERQPLPKAEVPGSIKPKDITDQLEKIAASEHFVADSIDLTERWEAAGVGIEGVEPIFRFMEQHPKIDFGTPGYLVHFVERFYGKGYEAMLLESIERRPVGHTVWMLNRIINGTDAPEMKRQLMAIMERAKHHPRATQYTQQRIDGYLVFQKTGKIS